MISSDGWNMLRIFLLGLTVAVMSLPASAEKKPGFNPHEGLFTSNEGMELKADVTHKSGDQYAVSLSTNVPMVDNQPGCGGGVAGDVTIKDKKAIFKIESEGFDPKEAESLRNPRYCEIKMNFVGEYKLEIEEVGGCTYYHGASCEFTGTLEHEASGI